MNSTEHTAPVRLQWSRGHGQKAQFAGSDGRRWFGPVRCQWCGDPLTVITHQYEADTLYPIVQCGSCGGLHVYKPEVR